jgi:glycerol-3-phosphate dehydrogenase (NAD+)
MITAEMNKMLRSQGKAEDFNVSVLMGANVANDVAKDEFCEATIGCSLADEQKAIFGRLFDTPCFKINVVSDVPGVELCGALKNVVAIGAGFCDGLGFGSNTKAAIVRIGLIEMQRFCAMFFLGVETSTFFESCGVADLITTCYSGRNRKCAERFASENKGKDVPATQKPGQWEAIEKDMLNGQKLQGTITAKDVKIVLSAKNCEAAFPLFSKIYEIAYGDLKPEALVELET